MTTITQADMRIATLMDGDPTPRITRRMNRHITAWEVYRARHHLPADAHTLAMTWQAWRATRDLDPQIPDFDEWASTIVEIYPCLSDGRRIIPDPETGELITQPDGARHLADLDNVEAAPYPTTAG